MGKMNKGMYMSKSYEYETPQSLFDELDKEFNFDLDPCASIKNKKCDKYYSKDQDGLQLNWIIFPYIKTVFMNPPYGKDIGMWVKKAYEESRKGGIVVGLLPTRTDTKWFHDHVYKKAEIRFIRGRLKFEGSNNYAPFPSFIAIWKY